MLPGYNPFLIVAEIVRDSSTTSVCLFATKPLHPMYAQKAILCRGEKPSGLWKECKTEKPGEDDLTVLESNPIVDLPNPASFH